MCALAEDVISGKDLEIENTAKMWPIYPSTEQLTSHDMLEHSTYARRLNNDKRTLGRGRARKVYLKDNQNGNRDYSEILRHEDERFEEHGSETTMEGKRKCGNTGEPYGHAGPSDASDHGLNSSKSGRFFINGFEVAPARREPHS